MSNTQQPHNKTKMALAFVFRLSTDIKSDTKIILAGDLIEANRIATQAGMSPSQRVLENVAPVGNWLYQLLILSQDPDLSFMLNEENKEELADVVNPEYINDCFGAAGGPQNEPGVNPFNVDLHSMGTPLDQKGQYFLMSSGLGSEGYRPHPCNRLYLINTKTGNRIDIFLGKDF